MSVVDLRQRMTHDRSEFGQRSTTLGRTCIYVDKMVQVDRRMSFDMTVGASFYDTKSGMHYEVPAAGILVPPRGSVVLVVAEYIAVPADMFGLVTGRGRYIFEGVLVSPGKVDPAFRGNLRIALFNASKARKHLKEGDRICSVCFFQLDRMAIEEDAPFEIQPAPRGRPMPWYVRTSTWMLAHLDLFLKVLPWLVAIAGAVFGFGKILK